jgi:hypothetical protein
MGPEPVVGPALADLSAAVAIEPSWADTAQTDDYFQSLWSDGEFLRITRR